MPARGDDRPAAGGVTRRRLLCRGTAAAAALAGVAGIDGLISTPGALASPAAGVTAVPPSAPLPAAERRLWATRADAAAAALSRHFGVGGGTGLYHAAFPRQVQPGGYATLWDFSRVLVGTMTLAGVSARLPGASRHPGVVREQLSALARYRDRAADPPGYDSCALPPLGIGGDRYYDDAAWIGLALVQHHRMTADAVSLAAATGVLNFVYPGGWDESPDAVFPGGVFWVQQGSGLGLTNHDRTATSNAPNAELAFHLAELRPQLNADDAVTGAAIHDWVNATLYDVDGSGLVSDHVRGGDGTIDPTLYTYNQGALVAADVMRYRLTGDDVWLARARSLAAAALAHFSASYYLAHSAAFNAIYFRGLLQLQGVLEDAELAATIRSAMRAYGDSVWRHHRSSEGLYRFVDSPTDAYGVLDQGAVLQIFATLAWDPVDYPKLG